MLQIAIVSKMTSDERQQVRELCGRYNQALKFIESSEDRDVLAREGAEVSLVYGNVRAFELPVLKQLKWIQCTWAGVENILYPEMLAREVIISNVRGQRARAMSEHIIAGLLYILRDFPQQHLNKAERSWSNKIAAGMLCESKILILGMGAIADELAPRLTALGAELYGVNSDGRAHEHCLECFTLSQMSDILPQIDHVVSCLPATSLTHKVINAEFLAAIKPGAAIVNVSRGSVLDEAALLTAIDAGQVSAAVLDVVDPEPAQADNPLWDHPRVLLTGHSSWAPRGDDERAAFPVFLYNLECFLKNDFAAMKNVVDFEKGY